MATKDFQTLNLKFEQVMFNSLVFTWERDFEVSFDIFSVYVSLSRIAYLWKKIGDDRNPVQL